MLTCVIIMRQPVYEACPGTEQDLMSVFIDLCIVEALLVITEVLSLPDFAGHSPGRLCTILQLATGLGAKVH